jgi:hypothetical protein
MLEYSDLTVYKNTEGMATALGFPVNSLLLQNNKPLFVGGKGKREKTTGEVDYMSMAVPAGLVCMTETICTRANAMGANEIGANAMGANAYAYAEELPAFEEEADIVPDGLYERLMELAEKRPMKKMTKRNIQTGKKMKRQTRKTKSHK